VRAKPKQPFSFEPVIQLANFLRRVANPPLHSLAHPSADPIGAPIKNLHVRGYKEKGNVNTPLDLAIRHQIDRFSLAIDVIDRAPRLRVAGAHVKEKLSNAYEHGVDKPEVDQWTWR
jgi:hypothetical protein